MGRPLTAIVLATDSQLVRQSNEVLALRRLCGRPLLLWGLDALRDVPTQKIVVVTDEHADVIAKDLQDQGADMFIDYVEQRVPRGSGDATSVGLTALPTDHAEGDAEADVLIIPAWLPLLDPGHLHDLVVEHRTNSATCTLLTVDAAFPEGRHRVVRDPRDRVAALAGERDLDNPARLKEIADGGAEVFANIMVCQVAELGPALRRLAPTTFDGGSRLTDVVGVFHDAGFTVATHTAETDAHRTHPAADTLALAQAETALQADIITNWLRRGVRIVDPAQTWIDGSVQLAPGVTVAPGTVLEGNTVVAGGARIGPHTHLTDCMVGAKATVVQTVGHDAEIGPGATVGPWAHLTPGASISENQQTGSHFTG